MADSEAVLACTKADVAIVKAWIEAIAKILLILKRIPNAAGQELYERYKVDAVLMAGGKDSLTAEGRKTRKQIPI